MLFHSRKAMLISQSDVDKAHTRVPYTPNQEKNIDWAYIHVPYFFSFYTPAFSFVFQVSWHETVRAAPSEKSAPLLKSAGGVAATIALRELETVNDVRLVSTSRPLGIDQRQQLSTIQQQRGALWAFRFRKWELVASYRQSKSEAINWLIAVSFSFSLLLIWWVSSPSSSANLLLMFFVIYFGFRFSHLLLSFALNRIGTDWPTAGVHWIPNRITTWSALTRTKHTPSCDSGASSLPATTRISTSR